MWVAADFVWNPTKNESELCGKLNPNVQYSHFMTWPMIDQFRLMLNPQACSLSIVCEREARKLSGKFFITAEWYTG